MPKKRAVEHEEPEGIKRATECETPNDGERAVMPEEPIGRERATPEEEPGDPERSIALDQEETTQGERAMINESPSLGERSPLVVLADAAMAVERVRVGAQVRLSHLEKKGRTCQDTEELHRRALDLEHWVDGRLAQVVRAHPASPWFSRVKGTGGECIGKVIGHIENFGRFYPVGDPMIPPYVHRDPVDIDGKCLVWMDGIERFTTPSKLLKYAGFVPGQRIQAGTKATFSTELRMVCWRLGGQLLKASGHYYEFYLAYKEHLVQRLQATGTKVVPTPKDRWCATCDAHYPKSTMFCSQCGAKLSLLKEPPGVMWEGHVHQMALRRMIKLFLCHLWAVWRGNLGLPVRDPYPIEYLGHTRVLLPEEFTDR